LLVVIHRDAAGLNFGHSLLIEIFHRERPTATLRLHAERRSPDRHTPRLRCWLPTIG
jgi:hypothetical protein